MKTASILTTLLLATTVALADYGDGADVVNSGSGLAFLGESHLLATTGSSATPGNGKKERAIIAYSIEKPAKPVEVGRLALDGAPFPQGIAVAGDRAFVVDGLNLWCVDAKDPAKMSVIAKASISDAGETGPRAIVLSPDGKTAYLACGRAGVRAYDLANPASPRLLWECKTFFSRDVELFADGVASAEELSGVAFVRDGKLVSRLKLPRDGAVSLRASGDRLFVGAVAGYSEYVIGCYAENFDVYAEVTARMWENDYHVLVPDEAAAVMGAPSGRYETVVNTTDYALAVGGVAADQLDKALKALKTFRRPALPQMQQPTL